MFDYEIIVDHKESDKKCTILPLKERPDFHIRFFNTGEKLTPLTSQVLLHHEGVSLDEFSKTKKVEVTKIAALDSFWRRLEKILENITGNLPELVKIPHGFLTAYPRKSKDGSDPDGGLATIEAIFIAAAFLGNWDESLLDKYYFKDKFLEINKPIFEKYKISPK